MAGSAGQALRMQIFKRTKQPYTQGREVIVRWILKRGVVGVRAMVSSRPSQNRKENSEGGQSRRGKNGM